MKKSTVLTVMAIFLILVWGIGFGIAQAGGTHTESTASSYEGTEALQVTNAPEEDMDDQPLFVENAPEEDMDLQGPIGVGTLPSANDTSIDDIDSEDHGG